MGDQTTEPAIEYTITATITTTSQRTLDDARDDFADLIGTNSAYTDVTATSIDVTDSTMPIRIGPYGEAVAKAVAEHLHEIERKRIDQIVAVDTATENAAYDAANTPSVRAQLYVERVDDWEIATWARHGDHWWHIAADGDEIGWAAATPAKVAALVRLPGWVEIPLRTQPAPAASEEQTGE